MSCKQNSHRPEVDLFLPEEPAAAYLRWTAWRGWAQRRILTNLRAAGQREAIRRFHGPMSLVWALFAQAIRDQAWEARKAGRPYVAPRVTADEELLALALAYHDRGRGWLAPVEDGGDIQKIPAPAADILRLEESVLGAVRHHMILGGAGGMLMPPPEPRSALPLAS